MNSYLLMITFRVWFFEIAVSGINYFLLMNRVYEPRVGELRAHRIGMTTRIVYIFFPFAYALVHFAAIESLSDMLLAGTYWLLMVLAFEWVGSFLLRRPVREILEGWHIESGYMWPYGSRRTSSRPLWSDSRCGRSLRRGVPSACVGD